MEHFSHFEFVKCNSSKAGKICDNFSTITGDNNFNVVKSKGREQCYETLPLNK